MKACELVGRIYDALLGQYLDPDDPESLRSLNILCVRLVFCLYAEDAGLFPGKTAFHDYLAAFPANHIRRALLELFDVLDTNLGDRDPYIEETLSKFPYVNGGLFSDKNILVPKFNEDIRQLILAKASADFDWSKISPTIFGSLFESTLNPDTRRKGGMHYTSIENIHKVIDPLFMDELEAEFRSIVGTGKDSPPQKRNRKLLDFQNKIASLKFLDPACGSGNFLTETFLSLRRLENRIILEMTKGQALIGFEEVNPVKVSINQFFGIEINDFAVDVAKTALWIAENQMLQETERIINRNLDMLPLKPYHNIKKGNALRESWNQWNLSEDVPSIVAKHTHVYPLEDLPDHIHSVSEPRGTYNEVNVYTDNLSIGRHNAPNEETEVIFDYIMGNPPFVGKKEQSASQKSELIALFPKKTKGIGNLDYVSGWYVKASLLSCKTKSKCAFLSTNSITQGEQVPILWRYLFSLGISIDFAWQTFTWDSESTSKAHVHCVVIGFSMNNTEFPKRLYLNDGQVARVNSINPYLSGSPAVFIESRKNNICGAPEITYGSMPIDDGHLILSKEEVEAILRENPENSKFIRKYAGGVELIQNIERWCLWLENATPKELKSSKIISNRVRATESFRLASGRPQTNRLADTPHLFGENRQPDSPMLVIPKVSSERRKYIPISFVKPDVVINGSALIVPNATLFAFGVLMSNVHNAWMKAVAGRMKSDYQYSGTIVYNNFPWPAESTASRSCPDCGDAVGSVEKTAQAILDARALYPESSLADLYDPTFMPKPLRDAHRSNDLAVMAAYGFDPRLSEEEIVAELFKMYAKLTK